VPRSDRKSASKSPGDGSVGKVVRGSFTMLEDEAAFIKRIQHLCLKKMMVVNKSEVLRASIQVLNSLPDKEIIARIKALPKVKAGRPPIE
jgi:hypothetical protein